MKTMMNLIICLGMMLALAGFGVDYAESAEKWAKVANPTDMTGPSSPELLPINRATEAYLKDLNGKGGVKGINIGIEWVDTKRELPAALEAYERFKDKVQAFYFSNVAPTLALKKKFEEDKLPCIFNSNSTEAFWPVGWVYGVAPNFADDWIFVVDFFLQSWKSSRPMRVALMFSDDAYGRSTAYGGGIKALKEKGIEVVAEEPVKMLATDSTSQLLRIKRANPDYILCDFIGATMGVVLKDMYRLGIKIPVGTAHGAWAEDLLRIAGPEACEGVITARAWGLKTDDTWGIKYANKFIETHMPDLSNRPAGVYLGIGTAIVIAEAVKLAVDKVGFDKLTGSTLKEFGFDQIKNLDTGGLTSRITYTATDHRGGTSDRLVKIVGGKPIVIRDWTVVPVCKP